MKYLHIGGETVVRTEDIVALFDLDNSSAAVRTRQFLRRVQTENAVVAATDDLPRSVVLCMEDGRERVYLSLLSTSALQRRLEEDSPF